MLACQENKRALHVLFSSSEKKKSALDAQHNRRVKQHVPDNF